MPGAPKVAFVVPRCGVDVYGGAERECFQTARHMAKYWDVHIVTTCARDYLTWKNHYPAGWDRADDVPLIRFPVDKQRNTRSFNQASARLQAQGRAASLHDQENWMRKQGPVSSKLFEHITLGSHDVDAFIFYSYLYATTYFGLPPVARRAILVPLAHDEWMLRLPFWESFFQLPAGFVFNTPEEKMLLTRRFPNLPTAGPIIGTGIDALQGDEDRFRSRYSVHERFILYIGRIDESKGCAALVDDFSSLRGTGRGPSKLVFAGPLAMARRRHEDIVFLGEIDEQTKWDALAACEFLVVPSPYESLSIVMLEAWAAGKPVLVNGLSPVLVAQCRRAQGGLWYLSRDEFVHFSQSGLCGSGAILGVQGRTFVNATYSWPSIEASYLDLLERHLGRRA